MRRRFTIWYPLTALTLAWIALAPALVAQAPSSPPGGLNVGILPFQDVSGNTSLGQLSTVLPGMLQSVLLGKTQLVPRQIQGGMPGQATDLAAAASSGQQSGVPVVALGTLLSGSVHTSNGSVSGIGFHGFSVGGNSKKIQVQVVLQVALVDAARGVNLATLQAKGSDTESHFDPNVDSSNYGTVNMQSAGFQNSALAKATNQALNRLARQMVTALRNFHPLASPAAAPAPPPPTAPPASPAPAAAAPTGAASAQPDLKAVKLDFVPGEKTIFYDDFTDMAPDEPPPHWKLRGGAATLMIGKSLRQLDLTDSTLTSPLPHLPANFTFESTIQFSGDAQPSVDWTFRTAHHGVLDLFLQAILSQGQLGGQLNRAGGNLLGQISVPQMDFSHPVHLDLWVQNGRVRVYVNSTRAVDVNQVSLPPISSLTLQTQAGSGQAPIGLQRVRVAASTPDFASAMAAGGKYITHGIHFATDSAILEPDSAPVVRQIADGLMANPVLSLEIDGYTDATGTSAHNLTLSQQRADAVRSVLISQFGIDAGRLTAKGLGEANPLGSNDSAAGRAENRRVEFIKVNH